MRFVLALGCQPVEGTSSPCERPAWSVPSSALETSSAVQVVRPAVHSPVPTGPASKKKNGLSCHTYSGVVGIGYHGSWYFSTLYSQPSDTNRSNLRGKGSLNVRLWMLP